ncbi:LysM peptidoglycan-binding domain-containing protein [Phosphitispora fastidiosa]|uniref:LysM peptidoglycan-binding domain-containing protein n=1 Tax=Phosphitispora fastidiosa TaxID=2837202 RepID=UPI001E64B58C|nr:LysM domain-containing protein [Phosphitispora fastidiosa]MBU7007033.1 LysM repeat protein [Phosphitispora fastidiosa]
MRKKRQSIKQECPGQVYWIIEPGDTFWKISRIMNIPLEDILKANPGVDPYNLLVGSKVCVPLKK